MQLQEMPGFFVICRLAPGAELPARFFCATRTPEELSVVCLEGDFPAGASTCTGAGSDAAQVSRGWRAFRVAGTLDFSLTGVLASLAGVLASLAAAGVSIFAVSTYDTDYLLVRDLPAARAALEAAGHRFLT